MDHEQDCLSCKIATIHSSDRNKLPHTPSTHPGQTIFLDILHPITDTGLTPNTTFPFYLILVDSFSRFSSVYGLRDKSTESVILCIEQYIADNRTHRLANPLLEFFDIERLRTDAGSQFTSTDFKNFCRRRHISLSIAAPKKQSQNHLAERSWQTINKMARSLLVHARPPDQYHYHAILYATSIFNILPIRDLYTPDDAATTPFHLFTGNKPLLAHYRVFGCPIIAKKWSTSSQGHTLIKQTERGVCGVFIGFPPQQKGYLLFFHHSRTIAVSGDVSFDETFSSAIATTWHRFNDSLLLQPSNSFIPDPDTVLKETGTIENFSSDDAIEEGDNNSTHTSSPSDSSMNDDTSPLIIDDSASSRRPQRVHRPPHRLSFGVHQAARNWTDYFNFCSDMALVIACATDATTPCDAPGSDASIFEPAPSSICQVLEIADPAIRAAWIRAYRKEFFTLLKSNTFIIDVLLSSDKGIPILDLRFSVMVPLTNSKIIWWSEGIYRIKI
jgi:transposase InsO family protein